VCAGTAATDPFESTDPFRLTDPFKSMDTFESTDPFESADPFATRSRRGCVQNPAQSSYRAPTQSRVSIDAKDNAGMHRDKPSDGFFSACSLIHQRAAGEHTPDSKYRLTPTIVEHSIQIR
jgi:hypothetical protein